MMTLYQMLYLINVGTVVTVVSGSDVVIKPMQVEKIPFVEAAPFQQAAVVGLGCNGKSMVIHIRRPEVRA